MNSLTKNSKLQRMKRRTIYKLLSPATCRTQNVSNKIRLNWFVTGSSKYDKDVYKYHDQCSEANVKKKRVSFTSKLFLIELKLNTKRNHLMQ